MTPSARFDNAIARFDAANAEDPNRELVDGRQRPKELLYAERLTAMLARFVPDASEALRLAAAGAHREQPDRHHQQDRDRPAGDPSGPLLERSAGQQHVLLGDDEQSGPAGDGQQRQRRDYPAEAAARAAAACAGVWMRPSAMTGRVQRSTI